MARFLRRGEPTGTMTAGVVLAAAGPGSPWFSRAGQSRPESAGGGASHHRVGESSRNAVKPRPVFEPPVAGSARLPGSAPATDR